MGLLDAFRPKWRHSDPGVRLEAVRELTDQRTLAKAARTLRQGLSNVPLAAVARLSDQKLLGEVARTAVSGETRITAAEKLADEAAAQAAYAEVARSSQFNETDRIAAAERLADQAVAQRVYAALAQRALVGAWVSPEAIRRLSDQKLLEQLALERFGPEPYARLAAVEGISDQAVLARVAWGGGGTRSWLRSAS